MNRDQFIKYLEDPFLMDNTSISELNEIIQEYPYFQTAHMLYAKVLHDQNNIKYEKQLKLTAAYATNREILFKLINSKPKSPEEVVENIETVDEVVVTEIIEEETVQAIAQEEVVEEKIVEIAENILVEETIEPEPQQEIVEDVVEPEIEEVIEDIKTEEVVEEISVPEVEDINEEPIIEEVVEEVSEEIVAEEEIITETVEETPQEEVEEIKADIHTEPEVVEDVQEIVEEPVVEEKKESIADQILRKVKAIKEAKAAGKDRSEKSIVDKILEKRAAEDKKTDKVVEAKVEKQAVEEVKEETLDQKIDSTPEEVDEKPHLIEDYLTIDDLLNNVSEEIPDLSTLAGNISTQSETGNATEDLLSFEIIEDKDEIEAIELVNESSEEVVVSADDEVFELEGYNKKATEENVESYSFENWLKLLEENKSDKSTEQIQESEEIDNNEDQEFDLIDRFISQDFKIKSKPAAEVSKNDFANKEEASEEGFMTETLANIYIKQKYYEKAISAYEKLSLKYPKKNAYFASQIEKIKEIINQQE